MAVKDIVGGDVHQKQMMALGHLGQIAYGVAVDAVGSLLVVFGFVHRRVCRRVDDDVHGVRFHKPLYLPGIADVQSVHVRAIYLTTILRLQQVLKASSQLAMGTGDEGTFPIDNN